MISEYVFGDTTTSCRCQVKISSRKIVSAHKFVSLLLNMSEHCRHLIGWIPISAEPEKRGDLFINILIYHLNSPLNYVFENI
uniref:Uncharacterized protein n=1 Tax=Anguilla anguilla TaxID=7936 RepID=A0A0E9QCL5_ANGAN